MYKEWAIWPVAALTCLALAGCDGQRAGRDSSTPSGFPVPRYVSLSKGEAASRAGPTDDHPVVSVYRARGLPVQVVAETEDWRRICDPEGGMSWVKKRLVDGKRSVIRTKPGTTPLFKRASETSPVVGQLGSRVIAGFDKCEKGWCRIKTGRVTGWVAESEVWGTAPAPQCRG